MRRRTALATIAGLLASPGLPRAQAARTLRFVPQADPAILDPIVTTGLVTRNHGFMIFDTLYGVDDRFRPQPQMVEGHMIGDDGLSWTMRLRDGLRFHDNTPVLARDVVASLRRWAARDTFGASLFAVLDEIAAPDDRTVRWRLRRPFPLLPDCLGKVGAVTAAIMPERLARSDPAVPLREMVGSGPFRFVADEYVGGSRVVYAKFDGYLPRPEAPSLLAGGKTVHFDRMEWQTIPDPATAAAALQRGEVDWVEQPLVDLLPRMRSDRNLTVEVIDPTGAVGVIRFNQLHPPFDNPEIRRIVLGAVTQSEFMRAVVGDDRSLWKDGCGFFPPGSPLANDEGMAALTGPRDLAAAARALRAAGYDGVPVLMMAPTDFPAINAMSEVTRDLLEKIGMTVDYVATDWGSALRRQSNRDVPAKGGYNLFCTYSPGITHYTPAAHNFLRGSGDKATFGWSVSPGLEALREQWLTAPDDAARLAIARQMQRQAFIDVPYVPLGLFLQPTAHRRDLTALMRGPPLFWSVRRS
ncbi:MAG: ABC transporter substrate-binding protein [Janthinobacterium lividum]